MSVGSGSGAAVPVYCYAVVGRWDCPDRQDWDYEIHVSEDDAMTHGVPFYVGLEPDYVAVWRVPAELVPSDYGGSGAADDDVTWSLWDVADSDRHEVVVVPAWARGSFGRVAS